MSAVIIPFPASHLYDVRLEFARRVQQRMAEIEKQERKMESVYAGERPCDVGESE